METLESNKIKGCCFDIEDKARSKRNYTKSRINLSIPGASGGGTVSHIHDIVCGSGNHLSGQVVAVEISPRMTRDLASLSVNRSGLIPIMGDARKTEVIAPFIRE